MQSRILLKIAVVLAILAGLGIAGCAEEELASYDESATFDSTPERVDGSSSYEFEEEDIEQAEGASSEVEDYCAGAVSEAQELGCLSHVEEVP